MSGRVVPCSIGNGWDERAMYAPWIGIVTGQGECSRTWCDRTLSFEDHHQAAGFARKVIEAAPALFELMAGTR